jgi:hypothetical protein
MASAARKKITVTEMHAALIALGHDKLWLRDPVPKGRKKCVPDCDLGRLCCGRNDLDVDTKGWDFTDKAGVIFPCPPGSQPSRFDDELDE